MGRVFHIVLRVVAIALLAYAVLFALAGTGLILYAAVQIGRPIAQVKRLATVNPRQTTFMAVTRGPVPDSASAAAQHRFVPLDSISGNLINAVIASEDDAFYVHPGFDVNAIAAAFDRNRVQNKIQFGGSTITQQLAKNLFLSGDRTYRRKYAEFLYTLLLEGFLTKDRILELYLNYVQWGGNIYGCEAAAQHYFHKPASRLTLWESARLSAVLAKPSSSNPLSEKSTFIGKRVQVIADNLYLKKQINDSGYTLLTGREPPRRDSLADSSSAAIAPGADTFGSADDPSRRTSRRGRHGAAF